LLLDWAGWIRENGTPAKLMRDLLGKLSPPREPVTVSELSRISVDDARDIPGIRMP
jgi:hypothetical protein